MLRFQDNHTTTVENFEDFILTAFVMIDINALHLPLFQGDVMPQKSSFLIRKLSPSAFVVSGLASTQRMHGIPSLNETIGICFHAFVAGVVLTEQEGRFCR